MPARPYKPRDKAKVEVGVQIVQRWIVAALRQQCFTCVTEVNDTMAALLERLNHRRFRKREGTRASLFAELDRPALQPLPGSVSKSPSGKTYGPIWITASKWTGITTACRTS